MNWFDRWLSRKVRRGLELERAAEERNAVHAIKQSSISSQRGIGLIGPTSDGLDSPADLNFRMYHAYNGYVMEVRHMDRRTDRQTLTMHLIPDGEDLGDSIAKIITLESLKIQ